MDIPTDEIFTLLSLYKADKRKDKINGGIGIIISENGTPLVLPIVKEVAKTFPLNDFSYLPISGNIQFLEETFSLLFRQLKHREHWVLQGTMGGTNALALWAQYISLNSKIKKIIIGTPTWENHLRIFSAAGLECVTYPVNNTEIQSINTINEMIQKNPSSWFLFQGTAHNPTGYGLTTNEWDQILEKLTTHDCSLLLDIAYLGLGNKLSEDQIQIEMCMNYNLPLAIAFSYSKIMTLYQHRTGMLGIYSPDRQNQKTTEKIIRYLFRIQNSNPAAYGEYIVSTILSQPYYKTQWNKELEHTRNTLIKRRENLYKRTNNQFSSIINGKGLFSLLPLNKKQIDILCQKYGIYILSNGRINVGGLSITQIQQLANSINSL